ncbi:MAG: hypothetical protein V3S98_03320 [Dehalococcoidia bacterium]
MPISIDQARGEINAHIFESANLGQTRDLGNDPGSFIGGLNSTTPSLIKDVLGGELALDFLPSSFDDEHAVEASPVVVAGTRYTFGVLLRAFDRDWCRLRMTKEFPATEMIFNMSTLEIFSSTNPDVNVVPVGGGWVWASLSAVADGSSDARVAIQPLESATDFTFANPTFSERSLTFFQPSLTPDLGELLIDWRFDNLEPELPPTTTPWARFTVRHTPGDHVLGNTRFTRRGIVVAQLFTPLGEGLPQASDQAKIVVNSFDGEATPNGIWFNSVGLTDVGPGDSWRQENISAFFAYDEVK